MFYTYQVLIWLILLLLISSKIKQKNWRIIFSGIAGLFSTLEISSVYLTDKLIDYRFYNHMNLNAIEGQGFQFVTEFFFFFSLFILISSLLYFISKKIQSSLLNRNRFFVPTTLASFILLSLPNGMLNEIYNIYKILNAEDKSFNQALKDLGISPDKYITPDQLSATKGKNIIVISIESLEQGFFGKEFDNITPQLSKLSKEWTYYNKMPVGPGGGWTAASLYNHQVGMPAFFKGQGNDFFQGTTDVKLTGLGHILNTAGYDSKYLLGNAEFAGMSDILAAYGITTVSQNNCQGTYDETHCGLNDYDLFKEAKLQIEKFDKDKPFALFMSTINTHFPNGIYDKRMELLIPKRENDLEFSVSAVDYLIGDFINYLKNEKLLDDTVIFIFPDHNLMGSAGPVIEKLRKSERQSYLITNVDEKILPKKTSDTLYQIDLPRMIVNGAEIKTNAKFLRDYIKQTDYIKFLNENRVKLTTLNSASIRKKNYKNGISISTTDNNLTIASDEDKILFQLDTKLKDETFDITFTPEMVSIAHKKSSLEKVFALDKYDKKHKRLHLIINIKDGNVSKTYFGNKQMLGIYKKGSHVLYSKNDIDLIIESNNAILEKPKSKKEDIKYKLGEGIVSITSSEWVSSKKVQSKIEINGRKFRLSRGLNLLYRDDNGTFNVENYDTYGSAEDVNKFTDKISSLIEHNKFWAIASNDAIKSDYPNFKEVLEKLNFKLLQTLNGRFAYIAYIDSNNNIKEFSSKTSLSYYIPSFTKPLSANEIDLLKAKHLDNNIKANLYKKDNNRFIAHAGGMIDGHKYTNSLEAMDRNYKNGFRLFELDISKTSDNIYVAAHDWKHWSKVTRYTGPLPPTRKVFLQQKIYKKYTPMDISDINVWFNDHPDAILVTDKVNTPVDFSNKFIDKTRLMMELFTWDAVEKGMNAKIKSAMPTGSILEKIKGDKISYLKKIGVTDIAASRRIVDSQKSLLKEIVASGINVFAFHVNFDKGKDEKYVVCAERDYFYGMYADKWDFNSTIDCAKY